MTKTYPTQNKAGAESDTLTHTTQSNKETTTYHNEGRCEIDINIIPASFAA